MAAAESKERVKLWLSVGMVVMSSLTALLTHQAADADDHVAWRVLAGLLALPSVLVALMCMDVCCRTISTQHRLADVIRHYKLKLFVRLLGMWAYRNLMRGTHDVKTAQEEVLLRLLSSHADTDLGQKLNLAKIRSRRDFVKTVPVTDYSVYKEYAEKTAKGDWTAMVPVRPIVMTISSGTSGEMKAFPVTQQSLIEYFTKIASVVNHVGDNRYGPGRSLTRGVLFAFRSEVETSEGGIPMGSLSSLLSPISLKYNQMWLTTMTTPPAVMGIKTFNETTYGHLLFALRDRNLGWMESGFSPGLYSTFTYLENTWERLVEDIRLGRISPDLNIPADIRQDLNLLLTPMPRRADELEREFSKGFTAICRRIWPNLRQLKTAASGSFALYAELLTEKYAKGVSIYSSLFNSSEAYMGINMWPGAANIHYLPTFTSTFFEFMPLSEVHKEQPKTYFLDQVRDGETYELLVTSGRSLYRYKQGDLLKVAGFTNSCPIFEFVARRSQLLSLRGERVSEQAMMNALKECANTYWGGTSIVDFTCCTSALADKLRDGTPLLLPHYIVFFELADSSNNNFLTAKQRNKLDDVLQRDVQIYKIERSEIYGIGAMEVHQVLQGTFASLHRYIHETSGSSYDQTKIPKLLLRTDHLKQLLARSTHTHIQQ